MQTLIYKTDIMVERAPTWLAPNSPLELRPQADGTVAVFGRQPSRWLTRLLGLSRIIRIGALREDASALLRPTFEAGSILRVRIVELQPAHLTSDRRARISVSVWGGAAKTAGSRSFANVGAS